LIREALGYKALAAASKQARLYKCRRIGAGDTNTTTNNKGECLGGSNLWTRGGWRRLPRMHVFMHIEG